MPARAAAAAASARRPSAALLRLLACGLAAAAALSGLSDCLSFAGGLRHPLSSRVGRSRLAAWPWEAQSDPQADAAYKKWADAYPEAAARKSYMDEPMDEATIKSRYQGLTQILGQDLAEDAVDKEPILLMFSSSTIEGSWSYITRLEAEDGDAGAAAQIVANNPRVLTIPGFELERTKPSLDSMKSTSAAINFLRPVGQGGLSVAIFGSFVLLILILRPVLYGVGGGPSLIEFVTSPITSNLPPIPRPYEFLETYGINLASLVAIIPIYQVGSSILKKQQGGK